MRQTPALRCLSSGADGGLQRFKIYNEEITILGTMAVLNSYGPAIDVLAAGAVDAAAMVTHTLRLDDFDGAIATVRAGSGLKVQIDPTA